MKRHADGIIVGKGIGQRTSASDTAAIVNAPKKQLTNSNINRRSRQSKTDFDVGTANYVPKPLTTRGQPTNKIKIETSSNSKIGRSTFDDAVGVATVPKPPIKSSNKIGRPKTDCTSDVTNVRINRGPKSKHKKMKN